MDVPPCGALDCSAFHLRAAGLSEASDQPYLLPQMMGVLVPHHHVDVNVMPLTPVVPRGL